MLCNKLLTTCQEMLMLLTLDWSWHCTIMAPTVVLCPEHAMPERPSNTDTTGTPAMFTNRGLMPPAGKHVRGSALLKSRHMATAPRKLQSCSMPSNALAEQRSVPIRRPLAGHLPSMPDTTPIAFGRACVHLLLLASALPTCTSVGHTSRQFSTPPHPRPCIHLTMVAIVVVIIPSPPPYHMPTPPHRCRVTTTNTKAHTPHLPLATPLMRPTYHTTLTSQQRKSPVPSRA